MTAKREVQLTGDTLAWVHRELAEIKSRLSVVQSASEQSRNLATDAAEKAHTLMTRVDLVESQAATITNLQEELRLVRDQLARAADDINSLRQSRDELERRVSGDAERERQERNDSGRRVAEVQRQVDTWQERVTAYEDVNRRNLEATSQLQVKLEALQADAQETNARQARDHTTLSRMDQELTRVAGALTDLHREDEAHKERFQSLAERLARLEGDLENMKGHIGRIDRIDDRLELVQAERSRHGERITDLTLEADRLNEALTAQAERGSLIEARISGYQDELRNLDSRLTDVREHLSGYLRAVVDLETEFRKRRMAALEKESRDIHSRGITLGEE